jgi:hypothetical protein
LNQRKLAKLKLRRLRSRALDGLHQGHIQTCISGM